jgi:hypothetical protein
VAPRRKPRFTQIKLSAVTQPFVPSNTANSKATKEQQGEDVAGSAHNKFIAISLTSGQASVLLTLSRHEASVRESTADQFLHTRALRQNQP